MNLNGHIFNTQEDGCSSFTKRSGGKKSELGHILIANQPCATKIGWWLQIWEDNH